MVGSTDDGGTFEGIAVEYVDNVLNLGLTVDCQMGWTQQTQSVFAKVFAGLRNMLPSVHFVPQRSRRLLDKSLLMPPFTYCCPLVGELSSGDPGDGVWGMRPLCVRQARG